MAGQKLATARKALQDQAYGIYAGGGKNNVSVAQPDPNQYNVFSQQYAQSLNNPNEQDLSKSYLDQWALQAQAKQDRDRYAADLAASQEAQLKAQQAGIDGNLKQEMISQLPSLAEQGAIGVLKDNYGMFDPVAGMVRDNIYANSEEADRQASVAGATADAYKAGIKTPVDVYANKMQAPTDLGPVPQYGVFPNQVNPNDAAAQANAVAAQTSADARMLDAQQAPMIAQIGASASKAKAASDDPAIEIQVDPRTGKMVTGYAPNAIKMKTRMSRLPLYQSNTGPKM